MLVARGSCCRSRSLLPLHKRCSQRWRQGQRGDREGQEGKGKKEETRSRARRGTAIPLLRHHQASSRDGNSSPCASWKSSSPPGTKTLSFYPNSAAAVAFRAVVTGCSGCSPPQGTPRPRFVATVTTCNGFLAAFERKNEKKGKNASWGNA